MAQKEQATANRNYKDTVFRMLFSDRQNLLSLYNAVSGSHYDDPEMLEIVTLENAIYMGMKNDLAFIIGTDLFLYEHQSTYNPNMPLRDLFYISSEYQKLVDHKSLYSSTLLKIPAPQFIVFYNGTEKKKDHWLNHLSESFENLSGEPKLELEVLTININEGLNKELMEQCQTLREYAQYVHCVRKYAKELDLNEAVKLAVDECIRNDILSEFLRANKSEVISMSIFEYDKEEEERKLRKAEYEAGVADGFNDGINTAKKDTVRLHIAKSSCAKPQIKIHARRYKNYFRANLPCLPQCHTCFYSGSLCNIIRSQHNSMSCLRITTGCHWLSGKFRMMQFVIRKSAFFHIILSDCLKHPFRNLFFLPFCITHIVFESLPPFSCDP